MSQNCLSNMNYRFAAALFLVAVTASGCGVYTFNPKGKSSIKTIAVERFENRTPEYGLEDQLTELVIDALINDGNLQVVTAENADAVLLGVLTRYERKPYQFDENDIVLTYAVHMYFDISLRNPTDDVELWTDKIYQIGVYQADTETEQVGQQKATTLLVEEIINRTTKSW